MKRPIHIGRPPSRCKRATLRSAWVPEDDPNDADCLHCLGEVPVAPPRSSADTPLARWRVSAGITQQQVCDLLGLSRPTWIKTERGDRLLRTREAEQLRERWPGVANALDDHRS